VGVGGKEKKGVRAGLCVGGGGRAMKLLLELCLRKTILDEFSGLTI
jgi:hypothetical protein